MTYPIQALKLAALSVAAHLNFESAIIGLSHRAALKWGFRWGERGTHTSRTIMLGELTDLFDVTPYEASWHSYATAAIEENCLGKRTLANRRISLQHLKELYALDSRVVLFRVLRQLWDHYETSRPQLALLLALARDPLLRATTDPVVRTPFGNEFARQSMKDAVRAAVGDRLNSDTLDKVVRNAAASWTQSGHLQGRGRKIRHRIEATPAATAYALLLGFATGRGGGLLFETPWCGVLDAHADELIELAAEAKRLGLLDLKQSGSIIDVSFPALLAGKERELRHGAYRQAG